MTPIPAGFSAFCNFKQFLRPQTWRSLTSSLFMPHITLFPSPFRECALTKLLPSSPKTIPNPTFYLDIVPHPTPCFPNITLPSKSPVFVTNLHCNFFFFFWSETEGVLIKVNEKTWEGWKIFPMIYKSDQKTQRNLRYIGRTIQKEPKKPIQV